MYCSWDLYTFLPSTREFRWRPTMEKFKLMQINQSLFSSFEGKSFIHTKISHIREAINWGHFHKFQFHKMMKGTCVLELTRKTVRNCVKKELSAIINKITPQGTTIFFNSLKAKRCCTYLVNILFFSNKKYYPLTAVGTNLR